MSPVNARHEKLTTLQARTAYVYHNILNNRSQIKLLHFLSSPKPQRTAVCFAVAKTVYTSTKLYINLHITLNPCMLIKNEKKYISILQCVYIMIIQWYYRGCTFNMHTDSASSRCFDTQSTAFIGKCFPALYGTIFRKPIQHYQQLTHLARSLSRYWQIICKLWWNFLPSNNQI